MNAKLPSNCVWIAQAEGAGYGTSSEKAPVELPENISVTAPLLLLRNLFRDAEQYFSRYDTAEWNPLGNLISPGDKVLLKPNWVLDRNTLSGGSFDCVVTHSSVIEAVLHYVVLKGAACCGWRHDFFACRRLVLFWGRNHAKI